MQSILSRNLSELRSQRFAIRIAKDLGRVLLSNGFIQLVSLAGGVIIARVLGPAGKGEVVAVFLYLQTLAWIASLGLSRGTIYMLAHSAKDIGAKIFTHSLFISITLGSLTGISLYMLFPMLFGNFSDQATIIGRILFLFLPLFILSDQIMNIFLGYKRYSLYNLKRIIESSLYPLFLFFLFIFNCLNIGTVLISFLVGTGFSVILGIVLLRRVSKIKLQMDGRLLKKSLSFGLKVHIGDILRMSSERLDRIIIAPWLGSYQFGLYAVATTISFILVRLINPVATIIFPELATYNDKEYAKKIALKTLLILFPIVFAFAGLLFYICPIIILFLFGEDFKGSIMPAKLLIIGTAFLSISYVIQYSLLGLGYPQYSSYANILSFITTIILLVFLVPRFGILGAAWTSMVAYVIQCITSVILLFRVEANYIRGEFECQK